VSNDRNNLTGCAVVVGFIAAIITIFGFITGLNSIRDIFAGSAGPTPSTVYVQATTSPTSGCNAYVDIGDSQSESGHNLIGWGGRYLDQPASPSGDTSFRYQSKGSPAFLTLCLPQIGVAYKLTTEVQDFGCDDSFEIFVNNDPSPIYQFAGTRSNIVRIHTVLIPANEIISNYVRLGF